MKQSYSNDNFKNIQESYQQLYNFKTLNSTLINRGWLNLKWKIDTDQGVFLVKQYHRDRFKGLESLKFALFQQQRLHDLGVPCPKLLMNQEEIIHLTASGEHFIIMDFCEGEMLRPGKLNKLQIYDLGRVIGKIHRHLNDGSLGTKSTAQFVLPSRESRITHWNSLMEEATLNNKLHLLPTIEQQLRVTETLDINAFHTFKQGWAHRDLWVDNLLFNEDTLSAVLDFDRLNYDYLNLDVARAILSCSLNDGLFQVHLASSFLNGYRSERDFPRGMLGPSLKMLWYLESEWWIRLDLEIHKEIPPARFAQEMIWLAEHDLKITPMLEHL